MSLILARQVHSVEESPLKIHRDLRTVSALLQAIAPRWLRQHPSHFSALILGLELRLNFRCFTDAKLELTGYRSQFRAPLNIQEISLSPAELRSLQFPFT
jgi:hypothetical protein